MPLSKGRVMDDTLVCCYHGLAYNSSGTCVHVPRQESAPSGLNVRSFPAVDRYGAIWLWMGDPKLADESKIFNCSLLDPAGAGELRIYFHVKANYLFINDNLADLLHIGFLHNPAVGSSYSASSSAIGSNELPQGKLDVRQEGNCIYGDWTWTGIVPPPTWKTLGGLQDRADGWVLSRFYPPSFFVNPIGFANAGDGGPESAAQEGSGQVQLHDLSMHYARNREVHAFLQAGGASVDARDG